MKVALVHDEIVCKGGAERVLLSLHRLYPTAPIYTMCYLPKFTYYEFSKCTIKTSFFQRIVFSEKQMKLLFFPIGLISMMLLKVENYDLVIFSTTYCAKYVRLKNNKKVIFYCHNPFRLAWYPDSYYEENKIFKNIYIKVLSIFLQRIDYLFAQRANRYIANSLVVKDRIVDKYAIKESIITVINPPVFFSEKCGNESSLIFDYNEKEFFLIVSRLEKYKKVELAIDVFLLLPHLNLFVVGEGTLKKSLEKKQAPNIYFLGNVPDESLRLLYQNAKALIFPQLEDFGITPLEANYWGVPVLAYGRGGVLETMIDIKSDRINGTAYLFDKQNVETLYNSILEFSKFSFDKDACKRNANRFSEYNFHKKIKELTGI